MLILNDTPLGMHICMYIYSKVKPLKNEFYLFQYLDSELVTLYNDSPYKKTIYKSICSKHRWKIIMPWDYATMLK